MIFINLKFLESVIFMKKIKKILYYIKSFNYSNLGDKLSIDTKI